VSTAKLSLVVLATVVIFAAGVLTGGLLVQQTRPRPPLGGGVPFLGRVEAINQAAGQLDLSSEQRRRVAEMVRNSREQIADYFTILEPDIQHVFRDLRQQILAELTPPQREAFEENFRQRVSRGERGERRMGNQPVRNDPAPSLRK
jgi:Spy/CpxP family protein refolding chaperone